MQQELCQQSLSEDKKSRNIADTPCKLPVAYISVEQWHAFCDSYLTIMDDIAKKLQLNSTDLEKHSNAFLVLLNAKGSSIDSRICLDRDTQQEQVLLDALKNGDWGFTGLEPEQILESAFTLYSVGKLSFHEKFTISDIIGTSKVYGKFLAHPILDSSGNFSAKAQELLLPCLLEGPQDNKFPFSKGALENLKDLIKQMPITERFFFEFYEQKLDETGSSPSKHSLLRENLATNFMFDVYPIELMNLQWDQRDDFQKYFTSSYLNDIFYSSNREISSKNIANISSKTHPLKLRYNGILKLSASVMDAIGLIRYGIKHWGKLIPRIGSQTIEDVELFSKYNARPAPCPDAIRFGIFDDYEEVHLRKEAYPELLAHDEYHRMVRAELGSELHNVIDALIELARDTFGFKWSKEIWILRDLNLLREPRFFIESFKNDFFSLEEKAHYDEKIPDAYFRDKLSNSPVHVQQKFITGLLAAALATTYAPEELDKCPESDKQKLAQCNILTTKDNKISHFGLCFVIDLVINSSKWADLNVSNNHRYWEQDFAPCYYSRLIQFAKMLSEDQFFTQDMKVNVIKFAKLLDMNEMTLDSNYMTEWSKLNVTEQKRQLDTVRRIPFDQYHSVRNNTALFLGFQK